MMRHICKQCGAAFDGGPRAYYCPSCRADRIRQQCRSFKARCKQGDIRRLGSIDICIACGKPYAVKAGLQKYCADCAPKMIAEADRIGGLQYYYKNRESINPVRYERRKKIAVCKICGTEFDAHGTRRVYCDQCRRSKRKQ